MKECTDREFVEQIALELRELRLQVEVLGKKVELLTAKGEALFKALEER